MVTKTGCCTQCRQYFHYTATSWGGRGRTLCDIHREEHQRKVTARRVARWRQARKQPDTAKSRPVPVGDPSGRRGGFYPAKKRGQRKGNRE